MSWYEYASVQLDIGFSLFCTRVAVGYAGKSLILQVSHLHFNGHFFIFTRLLIYYIFNMTTAASFINQPQPEKCPDQPVYPHSVVKVFAVHIWIAIDLRSLQTK